MAPAQTRRRRGAIGVLIVEGRILMIRRAEGIPKAGYWCFPGGHVERGERSRDAVVREFDEELSLRVKAVRRLGAVRVEDSGYVLAVWLLHKVGGDIRPAKDEIAAFQWVDPQKIRDVGPGLPSNDGVFALLGV